MNKKTYDKNYYLKNKNKITKRNNKWVENNRDKVNAAQRRWHKTSIKSIYKTLKQNSRKRRRIFDLKQKDFIKWYNKQIKQCFYCKVKLKTIQRIGYNRFEIDRINNKKPYKINNMVLCCRLCNCVKGHILNKREMIFIGINVIKKKWKTENETRHRHTHL